jgi:hypothetical protein
VLLCGLLAEANAHQLLTCTTDQAHTVPKIASAMAGATVLRLPIPRGEFNCADAVAVRRHVCQLTQPHCPPTRVLLCSFEVHNERSAQGLNYPGGAYLNAAGCRAVHHLGQPALLPDGAVAGPPHVPSVQPGRIPNPDRKPARTRHFFNVRRDGGKGFRGLLSM